MSSRVRSSENHSRKKTRKQCTQTRPSSRSIASGKAWRPPFSRQHPRQRSLLGHRICQIESHQATLLPVSRRRHEDTRTRYAKPSKKALPPATNCLTGMQPPHSISLYPGTGCADGKNGDHIILAPAYTVTSDEVRQIVDITVAVITQFFAQTLPVQQQKNANGSTTMNYPQKTTAVRR